MSTVTLFIKHNFITEGDWRGRRTISYCLSLYFISIKAIFSTFYMKDETT